MAPNRVINARSAVSIRTKRDTLFAEAMRRLSALDECTTPEERRQVMAEYSNAMRRSGYGPSIRQDILQGALTRDRELRKPGVVQNRSREEIQQAKNENNLKYVNTWFLRGQHTSVVKVQATPGGALVGKAREKIGNMMAPDGGRTLIVEAAGLSITAGLRNPDPSWPKGCPHQDKCPVDPKQTCGGSRIVYQLNCTTCEAAYLGTSGHTLHKRSMEHLEAVRRGNTAYAMARHYATEHPEWDGQGDAKPFSCKILRGPNIMGNIQRYLEEALLIRDATDKGDKLLNGRGEWGRTSLKRLAIVED